MLQKKLRKGPTPAQPLHLLVAYLGGFKKGEGRRGSCAGLCNFIFVVTRFTTMVTYSTVPILKYMLSPPDASITTICLYYYMPLL
jgi:hypothetical protein